MSVSYHRQYRRHVMKAQCFKEMPLSLFSPEKSLERFPVMLGMSKAMVGGTYSAMSNTIKPLTNGQTVRDRRTPNAYDERAFRKGLFREILANISNIVIKFLQVLKRSISTKYVRTMTSNHRNTLTNLTQNLDAGECKLIFDDQQFDVKDSNDHKKSKKAVMLDEREAAYQSEDASNFLTVMIIIPYIFKIYLSCCGNPVPEC